MLTGSKSRGQDLGRCALREPLHVNVAHLPGCTCLLGGCSCCCWSRQLNISSWLTLKFLVPQTFAERLFARLQKANERLETRLAMMAVISRAVGVHQLLLLNFYPFLQKYIQPHQRDVTQILAILIQVGPFNSMHLVDTFYSCKIHQPHQRNLTHIPSQPHPGGSLKVTSLPPICHLASVSAQLFMCAGADDGV
jgi:hypothetical protein